MQSSLLGYDPKARGATPMQQVFTLLRRKELPLKCRRPITTICEVLLPVVLCGLVLLSKLAKDTQVSVDNTTYVQDTYELAAETLGFKAFGIAQSEGSGHGDDIQTVLANAVNNTNSSVPNAIWPLSVYLTYAATLGIAPFDGTFLAVSPDVPQVRQLLNDSLRWPHADVIVGDYDRPIWTNTTQALLRVRYYDDDDALESAAIAGASVWCGLLFEGVPPASNWSFTLRYNHSRVPKTARTYDKFTPGLSTKFVKYYSSGFLSLQTALSDAILRERLGTNASDPAAAGDAGLGAAAASSDAGLGAFVYAAPFPTAAYANNRFLDHAGPLVGLVIVLSFLIPLATMLRALVLEKESKLREGLLMSSLSLSAYYGSILLTYGLTFVVVALLGGALITPNLFPLASPLLVMLLFVLFALSVLAYTATLSAFFRNARVAAILGPLSLFLSSQLIFLFLDQQTGVLNEGLVGAKALTSLLPAMAFYLGASRLALYEGAEQAMTFSTLFDGDFPFGASLVILALDILIWGALAWYLDQVVPSEFGLQQPWYFLCTPSYWCGGRATRRPSALSTSTIHPLGVGGVGAEEPLGSPGPLPLAIEDDAEAGAAGFGVCIQRLKKVFSSGPNNGVAVAGLELSMRPGQITSLLGANGAGKTTTISMLTGLLPPTSGDAWIGAQSIRTGMRAIRTSLGVCPQQNVLFTTLSPHEHLTLHGELKGIWGGRLASAIDEILALVGLTERANVPSAALSGGQKRKLCLAIALLGGPETCFLDEPTSGMDPHSRRSIWALLRAQREGRTIVLTTHFLDEAEILSDRIAIMAEGSLRCAGSPLFLKSRLGCGYRLTLAKKVGGAFDAAALLAFLHIYEENAELTIDERFYIEVNMPSGSLAGFASLFRALDAELPRLGIAEYGLTCTTLEDVFLRINQNNMERLDRLRTRSSLVPESNAPSPPVPMRRGVVDGAESAGAAEPPLAVAAIGAPDPSDLTAERAHDSGGADARMRGGSALGQLCALLTKRKLQAQRDVCATCCQLLFPVVLVGLALMLLSFNLENTGPRLLLSPHTAFGDTADGGSATRLMVPPIPPAASTSAWADAVLRGSTPYAPMVRASHETTANLTEWLETVGWTLDDETVTAGLPDSFPAFPTALSTRLMNTFWRAKLDGVDALIPPAALSLAYTPPLDIPGLPPLPSLEVPTLLFQSKQMHALPTLLSSLYDARLRQASGGAMSIAAASHPLPRTRVEQAEISIALSAFASIMILIPFAFVAASFVTPHVRERETGSKQMQYVSGVGGITYWLASWLWDAMLYTCVLVCTLVVFLLLGSDEFTGSAAEFGATAALLAAFGAASIGFASVASFAFTVPSTALLLMIAFHFISGFGLVIADTIFLIVGGGAEDVNKHLSNYVYPLFPAYCLGKGFLTLSTRAALTELPIGTRFHRAPPPLYGWDQLGSPITFCLVECLVACIVTLVLQLIESRPTFFRSLLACSRDTEADAAEAAAEGAQAAAEAAGVPEDESVVAEREAVDALAGGSFPGSYDSYQPYVPETETELILMHLKKQYGGPAGKLAVRDLSLRVSRGECFGFLGVNGAGKSTTFSMLTGAVSPSSGDATLRGLSILSQQDDLRKLVGFCPQHDALESLLTPRETLRLYANIKGVPSRHIDAEVDDLLHDLDLAMFASKQAGTLSGGNKRKLCVGVALIGRPQLVLLDEPSSGMDAASKRFLWQVIKRRTASCCTILTTHSMEECEALCSRIGVMVDGAMRCLGPIQSLKSRYGQGYKLDLRLEATSPASAEDVAALVAQGCPGAKLEEAEPPCVTLTIPQRGTSLSAIFAHLAVVKERLGVSEVSLSQCTLEQIFLLMASKQALRQGDQPEPRAG